MTFLAAFGLWFWIIVAVGIISLFACVKFEKIVAAWTSLILCGFLLWWIEGINIVSYVYHNPLSVLIYFVGYAAVGLLWSFAKWFMFNREIKITYDKMKANFLLTRGASNSTATITSEMRDEWIVCLSNDDHWKDNNNDWHDYVPRSFSVKKPSNVEPQVIHYKAVILFWMSFWPISITWSIIHDAVERFFTWLYERFYKIYASITHRMFKGIGKDFGDEE